MSQPGATGDGGFFPEALSGRAKSTIQEECEDGIEREHFLGDVPEVRPPILLRQRTQA